MGNDRASVLKQISSFFLFLLLFTACTFIPQREGEEYGDFLETKRLTAVTHVLDSALFRYPFRIKMDGDRAVVLDLHGFNHYFHLFHYPDFSYITSWGKSGNSPEEMLSPENMRWDSGALWTLDANKSEISRFQFGLEGLPIREKSIKLDKNIPRVLDFTLYGDSAFIIPDYSGENRFSIIDSRGNLIKKFGSIPTVNAKALIKSGPAFAQAWRSFIDYNPCNGVLAAVTQLGEVLEIYNLRDSTSVVCRGPHGEPKFQIEGGYGIPTGIMGFSDVQVTENAIYAVFHGRSFKELQQQPRGEEVDGGKYIYLFSLTGEPLKKYELDHHIYGISVDEDKGIITATDVNKNEAIIEYKI